MKSIVEELIKLADSFDKEGLAEEVKVLDSVIISVAKKEKKSKSSKCREKYYDKDGDHFKGPDRFDSCVKYQKCLGKSEDAAEKICGYIKHHIKSGLLGIHREEKEWSKKIIAEDEKELNIITLAQMEDICPECAQEMKQAGLNSIEVDAQVADEMSLQNDTRTLGSLLMETLTNTSMQMGQGKALERVINGEDLRHFDQNEMYQALKGLVSLLNINV